MDGNYESTDSEFNFQQVVVAPWTTNLASFGWCC
jgi:hypothetical protein